MAQSTSVGAIQESSPRSRRGEASTQAICDAVIALLVEVGYDRLSMDAVAARARAGKATIYRHWPDKAAMVLAAIRARAGELPADFQLPDTGTLRGDLLALGPCPAHHLPADLLAILPGLFMAMRDEEKLAALMRRYVVGDALPHYREIVRRGVHRGEVMAGFDADKLGEIGVGVTLNRLLVDGGPIDDRFNLYVVDEFMLPLLHGARAPRLTPGAARRRRSPGSTR
jgi:AcrR family transcriptional regulator